MHCPRCNFDRESVKDACPQCGYHPVGAETVWNTGGLTTRTPVVPFSPLSDSARTPAVPSRALSGPLYPSPLSLSPLTGPSRPLTLSLARSGDLLGHGRYRLIDQLVLPDNQQGQGAAWLANDTSGGQTQVVIREVLVPTEDQKNKQYIVRRASLRLSEVAQRSGFPKVLDVFQEFDNYFIVFQHIEGESLASLLRRQGGALPERTVVAYGCQLCEMLTALARQPQPVVHGAISPETVIVSPDRSRVYLIHLPLFPPREPLIPDSMMNYKAPEQARNIVDAASDLYAVAATMHHAVTGFNPQERIAFFYPPARRLNPLVSPRIEMILAQELHLSPSQRYARAADMQADLSHLLVEEGPKSEQERTPRTAVVPVQVDLLAMRRESRRRSREQISIFGALCLVILIGVITFVSLYPSFNRGNIASSSLNASATSSALRAALDNEWLAEAPLYQSRGIGISDGRHVFDTYAGHAPATLQYKKQAAQALLSNNLGLALNDYAQAIRQDKTDAEARIYYEDLQIVSQKDPFITIVLGLPLDENGEDLALSRPDMQAAFAFQHQVNMQKPDPLPGGAKLRLLIANSGSDSINNSAPDAEGVTAVAQFITRRIQIGNPDHIVAVVGWPNSTESENALSVLSAARIPLISQTASSTLLSGSSPYFFHVNPADNMQGFVQGWFAYQSLEARNVLILSDSQDPYSQSLADSFSLHFQKLGGRIYRTDNFTEGQTAVDEFRQQAVQDALSNHVDLLYLAGSAIDAVRLAHALGEQTRMYGYLADLKILGGDAFDNTLLLGNGTGPDATLAQTYPQDMQRLIFTSFAHQAEGGVQLQNFLHNWVQLFGAIATTSAGSPVSMNSALMVEDAFGTLAYAMGLINGPLTGESLRAALMSLGKGSIAPYKGVSGQIAFDENGNPVNKPLVLLAITNNNASGQDEITFLAKSDS